MPNKRLNRYAARVMLPTCGRLVAEEPSEVLKQAIQNATENLCRSYEPTGGVAHDGEKGAFREFFVAQLIRPLLPHHYGVGSGVVVASDGAQSRQTDVLIFDRRRLPPILLAGDRGLFPIDSVLAAIEVKSEIRAGHYSPLVDAARRLALADSDNPTVRESQRRAHRRTPYTLVHRVRVQFGRRA